MATIKAINIDGTSYNLIDEDRGTIVSSKVSDIDITQSTNTKLTSIEIQPGSWIFSGACHFDKENSASGSRCIALSTTISNTAIENSLNGTSVAAYTSSSTDYRRITVGGCYNTTVTTAVYLNVFTSNAITICNALLKAVRIV